MLSYIAYLRRSSSLSFIPLSPSNLRPFGAPPSTGRREYPREPLPLEGAAERSEAGLAFFLGGARVLSYIVDLRRSSPLSFIPPEPYPARFARHLPLAGKALSVVILFPKYACIRFDDARIALLSYRSLPHWERRCRGKRYSRFFIHSTQKRPSLTSGRFYVYYLLLAKFFQAVDGKS